MVPGIILFMAMCLWLWSKARDTQLYPFFWWALVLKLLSGLALGWLYFNYYEAGDTISYMQDAITLKNWALENPGGFLGFLWSDVIPGSVSDGLNYFTQSPRALFFTKVLSIVNLVCGDQYWLISLFCSLFSFAGFYFFANTVNKKWPGHKWAISVAFLFFPSVVLWTSGVIKESLALGTILGAAALLIADVMDHQGQLNWKRYLAVLILLFVAWKLKYYFTAALIPTLISAWSVYKFNLRRPVLIYIMSWVITLFLVITAHFNLSPDYLPQVIKQNHDLFIEKSSPGDYIEYSNLSSSWISIVRNTPLALWSGLFRPFFGDANNLLKWFVVIENLVLLLLLMFQYKNLIRIITSKEKYWLISSILFITILAIFLSLSTPNFGTLIRYKSGFWFLWVYLILRDHPIFAFLKK